MVRGKLLALLAGMLVAATVTAGVAGGTSSGKHRDQHQRAPGYRSDFCAHRSIGLLPAEMHPQSLCTSCSGGDLASMGNSSSKTTSTPGARAGQWRRAPGRRRLRAAWRPSCHRAVRAAAEPQSASSAASPPEDDRSPTAVDCPRVRSWWRAGPPTRDRSARPRRAAGPPGRGSGPGAARRPATPASPRCAGRTG